MKTEARHMLIYCVLAIAVILGGLWSLSRIFQSGEPSVELTRATREALQMAREAREEAEDARRTASALRIVALVAGVSAPLVIAYLVYKLRAEPIDRKLSLRDAFSTVRGFPSSAALLIRARWLRQELVTGSELTPVTWRGRVAGLLRSWPPPPRSSTGVCRQGQMTERSAA